MALARRVGGELVNADALQVYRGFDRGTAKPDAAARAAVPHHLLDVLDPREPFSAGEFARRARGAIADITVRGRLPIIVGGSGFYLRAPVARSRSGAAGAGRSARGAASPPRSGRQ